MTAQKRHRGFPRGFTLTELVVSVAILAAMILIVNGLLIQTRRAVKLSQAAMEASANARAIIDHVRADLSALTRDGFLGIRNRRFEYEYLDGTKDPHFAGQLIFTVAGTYRSVTSASPLKANSGIVYYGHGNPSSAQGVWDGGITPEQWVLMRRLTLLTPGHAPPSDGRHYDYQDLSLGYVHSLPWFIFPYDTDDQPEKFDLMDFMARQTLRVSGGGVFNYTWDYEPLSRVINTYPDSLERILKAWPYLAAGCTDFLVEWTDGGQDVNGNVRWYGGRDGSNWAQPDPVLDKTGAWEQTRHDGGDDLYFVDFGFQNRADWPEALRISFTLGEGESARKYELVVDLPG